LRTVEDIEENFKLGKIHMLYINFTK